MNSKIGNENLLKNLAMSISENPRFTLTELAESVGISKASLHRICGTRENLELMLSNEASVHIEEVIAIVNQKFDDYEFAIQKMIEVHMINKEYLFFAQETQLCVDGGFVEKYINSMDNFFFEGKKDGFFRIDFDNAVLTDLFISTFSGIVNSERMGRIPTASSVNIFKELFLNGVKY